MPLIPALGRQRQADLCEFEANLFYKGSSRTAKAVTQESLSQKNKLKTKTTKNKQINNKKPEEHEQHSDSTSTHKPSALPTETLECILYKKNQLPLK